MASSSVNPTPAVTTDPPTVVATAYRWMHRGDLDMARFYLTQLADVDRAEARMNAVRLAAMLAEMSLPSAAQVAAAALTPDALPDNARVETFTDTLGREVTEVTWASNSPLPDGVDGRHIGTRLQQHAAHALADACPWCGVSACPDRDVHERLHAMAESTWLRRARS